RANSMTARSLNGRDSILCSAEVIAFGSYERDQARSISASASPTLIFLGENAILKDRISSQCFGCKKRHLPCNHSLIGVPGYGVSRLNTGRPGGQDWIACSVRSAIPAVSPSIPKIKEVIA